MVSIDNNKKDGTFNCSICDSITFGAPKVRTPKGKAVCKWCIENGRYKG